MYMSCSSTVQMYYCIFLNQFSWFEDLLLKYLPVITRLANNLRMYIHMKCMLCICTCKSFTLAKLYMWVNLLCLVRKVVQEWVRGLQFEKLNLLHTCFAHVDASFSNDSSN